MKTIIFNGSPRMDGDTAKLTEIFEKEMEGQEVKIVHAYKEGVRPCIDCRWCFANKGCAIKDGMQEIYSFLEECDHIVIASPIYFGELTGMLLSLFSRFQTYFSAKYVRKELLFPKKRTGAVFLCAGSGGPREKAESTAEMLLNLLNCENLGTVYAEGTDKCPAMCREDIIQEVRSLAEKMRCQKTEK